MTYGMSLRMLLEGWLSDVPDIAIAGVNQDSRSIEPGFAFVAVQGEKGHGLQYAQEAIANGCVAIIHDGLFENGDIDVPMVLFDGLQGRLGELASPRQVHLLLKKV